jgi:integrase
MKLKKLQIDHVKCPQDKTSIKLFDGGGLYVEIYATGSKIWRWKYRRPNGKENRISLGSYSDLDLKQARLNHSELRLLLSKGIDPAEQKKAIKESRAEGNKNTFEVIAREWFHRYLLQEKWTESHSTRIIKRLERNIFPFIGHIPIEEISKQQLISVIDKMLTRGVKETGRRGLQNCDQIYKYAIVTDRAKVNIAANIKSIFPTVDRKNNFPAVTDPKRLGEILRMIDTYIGYPSSSCAFKLMPFVFVRTIELRRMKWKDIHFDKAEWRHYVTKTGIDHIVPLSKQAIKILKEIYPYTKDNEYVFASDTSRSGYINENSLLNALRSLNIPKEEMCIHSWRSTAKTLLEETLNFKREVVEHQIAHKHYGPYDKTNYLVERKQMMQQYADYLDKIKSVV